MLAARHTHAPLPGRRVAVIGAGAAGLVTARELQREGHDVQVYEASPRLGGIWNYQEEVEEDMLGKDPHRRIVHSSLYSSLRTNLPREIMSFSDFPFIPDAMHGKSKDPRRYPHHTEVLAFLEAFAEHFNLLPLIHFNTNVVRLERAGHQERPSEQNKHGNTSTAPKGCTERSDHKRWTVITQPAHSDRQAWPQSQESFDAVIVAVGNYHEPSVPHIEGMDSFPGLQMHCHNFRHSQPFRNQQVLIVGASFSGMEVAGIVAEVAKQVFHSARTWHDNDASKHIRPNLERMHMLTKLHSDGSASFDAGRRISNIDTVIYCTGYEYKYPFLEHLNLITTGQRHVHPLYRHVFVPSEAPTLAFIGLTWKSLRNLQFELQSKWIAQVLSGKASLPDEATMMKEIASFYQLLAEHRVPVIYYHCQTTDMPVDQWRYNDMLRLSCNPLPPPNEPWRIELHNKASGKILQEPDTFRDHATPEDMALFERAAAACSQMWLLALDAVRPGDSYGNSMPAHNHA